MIVCFPAAQSDLELAQSTLRRAAQLDQSLNYPLAIIADHGVAIEPLIDVASKLFTSVIPVLIDPCPHGKEWPRPQNWAWQRTARWVEFNRRPDKCWLWWEPDAIPLCPSWLDRLDDAYRRGNKPFAGLLVESQNGRYMAGNGIYPAITSNKVPQALRVVQHPFDVVAGVLDGSVTHCADLSHLLSFRPRSTRDYVVLSHEESCELSRKGFALTHSWKGGYLATATVSMVSRLVVAPSPKIVSQPPFTEQTNWSSGYFTFPLHPTELVSRYNSSIIRHNGRLLLFTRRHRWNPSAGRSAAGNRSTIDIWTVRSNMQLDPDSIVIKMPARYPDEQWEDPRVVAGPDGPDGSIHLMATTWVHRRQWKCRQSFLRLGSDLTQAELLWEPAFGNNSPNPTHARGHEKNWIWFRHDNQWLCQYQINPTIIFAVDSGGHPVKEWRSPALTLPWQWGEPRGGTPLTVVGNELVGFFHSSQPWQPPYRRYFMGAYSLSAQPPFNLLRMTRQPLLIGSEADFRVLGGPLVIFPNGALLESDQWLVTFGVNDEMCGWIKVPAADLDSLLIPLTNPSIEPAVTTKPSRRKQAPRKRHARIKV